MPGRAAGPAVQDTGPSSRLGPLPALVQDLETHHPLGVNRPFLSLAGKTGWSLGRACFGDPSALLSHLRRGYPAGQQQQLSHRPQESLGET